jgi:hypothetical protein
MPARFLLRKLPLLFSLIPLAAYAGALTPVCTKRTIVKEVALMTYQLSLTQTVRNITAPQGLRLEVIEFEAPARFDKDGRGDNSVSLVLTQGGKPAVCLGEAGPFGFFSRESDSLRLVAPSIPFGKAGSSTARKRLLFLVAPDAPLEIKSADKPLNVPSASTGVVALPSIKFEAKEVSRKTAAAVVAEERVGGFNDPAAPITIGYPGAGVIFVSSRWKISSKDASLDHATIYPGYFALRGRDGVIHPCVGMMSNFGTRREFHDAKYPDNIGGVGAAGRELDPVDLVFVDFPGSSGATLVFLPSLVRSK